MCQPRSAANQLGGSIWNAAYQPLEARGYLDKIFAIVRKLFQQPLL